MKNLIFLFVLLFFFIGTSQNLVINGSFEEFEKCPDDYSQFKENVKDWQVPTFATPDFYSNCDKFSPASAPNNHRGWQKANEGNNYAGLILFNNENYREYITGTLTSALIKGNLYKMKFYISLADISGVSINSIGVLFNSNEENFEKGDIYDKKTAAELNKSIKCIQAADYKEKDDFSYLIDLSRGETFKNTKNWMLIETEFTANGSEKYFSIGNFKNNKQTKYELTRRKIKDIQSYYYIDDVCIINITNQINQKTSLETNKTYTLKSVQFEFDKATLIKESTTELDKLVNYLLKNPTLKVTINGHTDYSGKAAYNQKLSEERAKSVTDYLISNGISKNRITSKGYGESQPIDPNEPEDAQAKNRRVEFILSI